MSWRSVLFIAIASGLLGGCLDTRDDIREQDERRALQTQVSSLQKNTADHGAKYQEIDEQMRVLNGRLDAIEAQVRQNGEKHNQTDAESQKQTAELRQKIALLTETVAGLQTQLGMLQQQADAANAAATAQEEKIKTNKELAGQNSEAMAAAVHEYDNKNYKKAIVLFEKYRAANPKGKSYPAATYKIGVSFKELGMKQEARAFFEEVVAKFPKSEEAKKAGRQLQKPK